MIIIVDWIDLFLATIPRKKRSHPLSMWLFSIPNMVNRQVSLSLHTVNIQGNTWLVW